MLVESFAAERSEAHQVRQTGRGELDLKSITDTQWTKMQAALVKEWNAWLHYDAASVVSGKVAQKVDESKILGAWAVWTNKGSDGSLEAKRRIVGKGFQEEYDDCLRRDSPAVSPSDGTLGLLGEL